MLSRMLGMGLVEGIYLWLNEENRGKGKMPVAFCMRECLQMQGLIASTLTPDVSGDENCRDGTDFGFPFSSCTKSVGVVLLTSEKQGVREGMEEWALHALIGEGSARVHILQHDWLDTYT